MDLMDLSLVAGPVVFCLWIYLLYMKNAKFLLTASVLLLVLDLPLLGLMARVFQSGNIPYAFSREPELILILLLTITLTLSGIFGVAFSATIFAKSEQ